MRSAIAEEKTIALALKDPTLLDLCAGLKKEMFSSELLGRVFEQLNTRHAAGGEVSLSVLQDLSSEEMSHVAGIAHRQDIPVSEQAFADCIGIIRAEHQATSVTSEDDLMAYQKKLKERKGFKV